MIKQIKDNFISSFEKIIDNSELEQLRVKFLGKNGAITNLAREITTIPLESRREFGNDVNLLKNFASELIAKRKDEFLQKDLIDSLDNDFVDITLPTRVNHLGKIHPISKVIYEVENILSSFGYKFFDGPEIEDDWHNFTALNVAKDHPARQMHDTFYVKESDKLLRTHTSNAQIRCMNESTLPIKMFTIGKTYRSDSDATHSPMFHQLECMHIDKSVNISNLKFCLEEFLKKFFEISNAPIRLRSSHFPFTEPSIEIDVRCDKRSPEKITIGEGNDWIEILGAGMIHPNVLNNCKIDPNEYQGFAFGVGIERLAMLKYGISDLRKFYNGNLKWLNYNSFTS